MKAKELINNNALTDITVCDGQKVVAIEIALTAINMAKIEMKKKAVEAFKENCQNPKDTEPCKCKLCVRWVGSHCELLDGFIDRLEGKP